MKINQTSCVTMYSHVQFTVIQACQPLTSKAELIPVEVAQTMNPQRTREARPELTQLSRSTCA